MALSVSLVLSRIRELVEEETDMKRVYSPSETDGNRVPPQFNELPCALVLPGPTLEYNGLTGRHTYEARVQIFEKGPDIGTRVNSVLPFVDLTISKFEKHVALGGKANSCTFTRQSGLIGLEYAGTEYSGYEITLTVSEQSAPSPEFGS